MSVITGYHYLMHLKMNVKWKWITVDMILQKQNVLISSCRRDQTTKYKRN